MKHIKVEYQVMVDKLDEMLPVIAEFIRAAQADSQHVDHYMGYQYKSDPTKFVHFMKFSSPQNEKFHQQADYTKKFVDALYPSCQVQPVFEELIEQ